MMDITYKRCAWRCGGAELRELYDLMIFVDVDNDTRLARRVRRDIVERGRDVLQARNTVHSFAFVTCDTSPGSDCHLVPRACCRRACAALPQAELEMRLARSPIDAGAARRGLHLHAAPQQRWIRI
jgi:hypothetical protein